MLGKRILTVAAMAAAAAGAFGGTATAMAPNCAGASSSTGSDTIAGPVYGSGSSYYFGVQGDAPDPVDQGGYVEASPDNVAVYGSSHDGTTSFRLGQYPCANAAGQSAP